MKRSLFGLAFVALGLGACSLAGDMTPPASLATAQAQGLGFPPTTAPAAIPDRAPDMAAGQSIYLEKCAPCHGETGAGDGPQAGELPNPPAAFTDPNVAQPAVLETWFGVVTEGRFDRFMPGFSSLDDDQRWDVVGYALSLGLPWDSVEAGKSVFARSCSGCHGDDGAGDGSIVDLTSPAFQSQRSWLAIYGAVTDGVGDAMPAFSATLSESDRWAVAAYVRSLGLASAPARATATATGAPTGAAGPSSTGSATPEMTPTAEVGGVSIRGELRNGTAGAPVPTDLQVTLHGFDGSQEAVTEDAAPDAAGGFTFSGIDPVPGRQFVVTTEYQGVVYASDIIEATAGQDAADLPITVFETTPATDALRISRLHLLFDFPTPEVMQVVELWLVSNVGDRTVVESDQGALEVSLPEGATGLALDGGTVGDRFELTATGFRDRQAVTPGENTSELIFSYNVPYARGLDFARPVGYPVDAVVAMTPDGGPRITGDGVQDSGVRQVSGAGLHTYQLGPVSAGGTIAFEFQGSGSSTGPTPSRVRPLLFGAATMILALVAAGWIWFRPRRAAPQAADVDDLESILWAIASLDNDHAAGRIGAEEYQTRREELTRRARQAGDGD